MSHFFSALEELSFAAAPVFYKLVFMSLAAGVMGMILVCLRRFTDRWITPGLKMALWWLVLAALLIPYKPEFQFSLFPAERHIETVSRRAMIRTERSGRPEIDKSARKNLESADLVEIENAAQPGMEKAGEIRARTEGLPSPIRLLYTMLPFLWLLGVAAAAVFWVLGRLYLSARIKSSMKRTGERELKLFQECRDLMGVRSDVRLVTQSYLSSPALLGVFHGKILLPDFARQMDTDTLQHIFFHELSHFRRKDTLLNGALLAVQIVYWFNPVIWLLFGRLREDMEILNDAYVLCCIGADKKRGYASSLIKVLGQSQNIRFSPKFLSMADRKAGMERRISMIKAIDSFKKHRIISCTVSLVLFVILGALFLTQRKLSIYEGKTFSMEYPKTWVAADAGSPQEELAELSRKTGLASEDIETLLDAYDVIFIDTERAEEPPRAMLGVLVRNGTFLDVNNELKLSLLQQAGKIFFGNEDGSFRYLERPSVKEIGENDYGLFLMQIDEERLLFQAWTEKDNKTYLFSYTARTEIPEEQGGAAERFEALLKTVRLPRG